MKSPMIQQGGFIPKEERPRYTEMQVMKSNAGYYVGTYYNNPDGYQEPGSRDSGYFATAEEAEQELKEIIAGNAMTRMTP